MCVQSYEPTICPDEPKKRRIMVVCDLVDVYDKVTASITILEHLDNPDMFGFKYAYYKHDTKVDKMVYKPGSCFHNYVMYCFDRGLGMYEGLEYLAYQTVKAGSGAIYTNTNPITGEYKMIKNDERIFLKRYEKMSIVLNPEDYAVLKFLKTAK